VTGRLLRELFGMREEYVVATKVHGATMPGENGRGLSRKHILASIDASLRRLGLDYVDLNQIHRWDPSTRADAIARERGVPTTQLALAWLLQKPGVTAPIVGATKLEHLQDALAAERLSVSGDEVDRLQEAICAARDRGSRVSRAAPLPRQSREPRLRLAGILRRSPDEHQLVDAEL
jgi:aryl-alcohol dehydrogenase-like predicted oxidoreductase